MHWVTAHFGVPVSRLTIALSKPRLGLPLKIRSWVSSISERRFPRPLPAPKFRCMPWNGRAPRRSFRFEAETLSEANRLRGVTVRGGRDCAFVLTTRKEEQRKTHQARDCGGAQEAAIVMRHAPFVFLKANFHQFRNVNVFGADGGRAGHGKIRILLASAHVFRKPDAFADKKGPDQKFFEKEIRPTPPLHIRLVPGKPVHNEQNMPRLFLDHRLKCFHELDRKKTGTAGKLEETEGEETIDAFAQAGDQKPPFGIPRHFVFRLRRQGYAVSGDQMRKHFFMARLFKRHPIEGFAQRL